MESRFLGPSVSRTSRYFEPNLVSLGFASLELYNFTPVFSNPRFLETPDNSNQFWLCDDDAATFEADLLTDEDILAEVNHSADANEEEEEEMGEDEIVIVGEPPKPPTQCELRHAIGVLA